MEKAPHRVRDGVRRKTEDNLPCFSEAERVSIIPDVLSGVTCCMQSHAITDSLGQELGMSFRNLRTTIDDQVKEFIELEKHTGKA